MNQQDATVKKQVPGCIVTVLSQMIGASLLATPYLFYKVGWVIALLVILLTVLSNCYFYWYFGELSGATGAGTYRELTERVINKKLSQVMDVFIIIQYFGVQTAYIVAASTNVISFIKNVVNINANSYLVKAVLSICVILPLCFLKNLKQLGKIATISSILIIVTAITIIVYFFIHLKEQRLCKKSDNLYIQYKLYTLPRTPKYQIFLYFLMYIPAMQGNFAAHNIIPNLVQELHGTIQVKKRVAYISVLVSLIAAFLIYLFVGLTGAAMFGEDILDNVLSAFSPCKQIWISVCELLYTFVIVLVYPLLIYPIKLSITRWAKKDPATKQGYGVMCGVSVAFVLGPMLLAMVLDQILIILGLFSSVVGILLLYIVPILLATYYPKIAGNESLNKKIANLRNKYDKQPGNDSIEAASQLQLVNAPESSMLDARLTKVVEHVETKENVKQQPVQQISKRRLIIGYFFVVLSGLVSCVGIYENGKDVVDQFVNK